MRFRISARKSRRKSRSPNHNATTPPGAQVPGGFSNGAAKVPPAKPQTHNGDIAKLPPALARLQDERVWVCWCWFWNGKKWTKPPRRVDDPSRNASSSDPTTWGLHEEAVAQVRAGDADGIGF